MPELVGNAALLVNGEDPSAIAAAVLAMLDDELMRQEYSHRAAARVRELYARERRREGLRQLVAELLGSGGGFGITSA